jgi:hypothetical protein
MIAAAKMGSQVLVPFRGSEDSHRHLKLMGDLGQVGFFILLLVNNIFKIYTKNHL